MSKALRYIKFLAVLALFVAVSGSNAKAGTIYFDGANFFCPTTALGVTCCDKKTYGSTELATATHGETVMECDPGESFFLRVPYPGDVGAGTQTWLADANIGNVGTGTGLQCYEISGVVAVPTGVKANLTFSYAQAIAGLKLTNNQTTAYSERASDTQAQFVPTSNAAGTTGCTDTVCKNGWVTMRFTRGGFLAASCTGAGVPSACCTGAGAGATCTSGNPCASSDTLTTSKSFVSDGRFTYP